MPPNSTHYDRHLFESLIEQIESAAQVAGGLNNASAWISGNTTSPINKHKPFDYRHHEYQIQILNDPSPEVNIRKSTQLGASELSIRLALAITAKFSQINVIYTLPTIRAAQKFAMSRFDPVIRNSPKLKRLLSKEVNSNELKQIGDSFLNIGGCNSANSAISVPARALLIDEMAFSDPEVVSIYNSRLGHQQPHERIVRRFSSPLYPNSDITAEYERGTQNSYFCWHTKCGQWVDTDILELLKIPGYDGPIFELTVADLDSPKVRDTEAFFRCPNCGEEITQENLCTPEYRAWVPKYSLADREVSSYDPGPLVLPSVRTPKTLLNDLRRYRKTQTWVQYALGRPLESASDSILAAAIESAFCLAPHPPHAANVTGTLIGIDVGRTCHVVYAKPVDGKLHIIYAEMLRQDTDNIVVTTIKERFKTYKGNLCVVDAGPDLTLVGTLQAALPYNRAIPCYFVRSKGGSQKLGSYEFDEANGVVKVYRTRAFDEFVQCFNAGKVLIAKGLQVEEEIRKHLPKLKRVMDYDNVGEEVAHWVSPDPENHFWLAIFYGWMAWQLSIDNVSSALPVGFPSLIGRARLKSAA